MNAKIWWKFTSTEVEKLPIMHDAFSVISFYNHHNCCYQGIEFLDGEGGKRNQISKRLKVTRAYVVPQLVGN